MQANSRRRGGRRVILILFLLIIALVLARCGPSHRYVDADQGRLDTASPPLANGEVGQTFVAHHPSLSAVEVLLVLYGADKQPASADEVWQCILQRDSPAGPVLATVPVPLAGRHHNDTITIPFPPQPDSQGKTYYLSFQAISGNRAGLWYASVDAYSDGTLWLGGKPVAGDLRFRTFYDEDVSATAAQAIVLPLQESWLLLLAALLLFIPGLALYLALGDRAELRDLCDLGAWAVSLTLAVLPLILLWTTTAGLHWRPWLFALCLGVLGALVIWQLIRRRLNVCVGGAGLFTLLLLALALATRLLEVRGLVLPAWVDSVHHTLITGIIAAQGQVPANYEPAFPGGGFIHHFGFHTVSACLSWLAHIDPPQAVLVYGQILNVLVAWTSSLLALRLSRQRVAGVTTVLVIGLLSPMPAYYVSWGRYTQLAGMALLPLAIVATMDAVESKGWRSLSLAAVAVAGLSLTHYRVLVFYGAFAAVYALFATWQHRRDRPALLALWKRLGILLGAMLFLVLPWVPRLWQFKAAALFSGETSWQGTPGLNVMSTGLLWFPGMRPLYYLAGLGVVAGLLRRRWTPVLILLWVGGLWTLVNLPWGGNRGSWLLPNSALAIAAFLPVALLIAELASALWDGARRIPWPVVARWLGPALAAAALVLGLIGAWRIVPIVNEQTVLATTDDLAAMQWIRTNTPPDARFLANAVPWQLGLYRGSDAGWWIPLLTGRRCTLPPVLYSAAVPAYVAEINEIVAAVSAGALPGGDRWQERCRELGIRYIYIGAKGGPLKPEKLCALPGLRVVYVHGPVWIFELAPPE